MLKNHHGIIYHSPDYFVWKACPQRKWLDAYTSTLSPKLILTFNLAGQNGYSKHLLSGTSNSWLLFNVRAIEGVQHVSGSVFS